MSPFFSIITASLNKANSIKKTIESIRLQKFKSYEHIIIDGASSDNTLEIIKTYDHSYNLKWLSEPDLGVPDAFNKAVNLSSGEYVIVIQADDYLLDDCVLEKVYKIISKNRDDIYSFPIIKELSSNSAVRIEPIKKLWWIRFRNIFPHQGIFVNRKLFSDIGLFDLNYTITEDYDFLYRALNKNCSVCFETLPVSYMGGGGPCSTDEYLSVRLHEEIKLQAKNEKNILWRTMQIIFWIFYYPYKTKLLFKTFSFSKILNSKSNF